MIKIYRYITKNGDVGTTIEAGKQDAPPSRWSSLSQCQIVLEPQDIVFTREGRQWEQFLNLYSKDANWSVNNLCLDQILKGALIDVWGDIKVADLERVIQFWSVRLEAEPTPAALPLEAKMDLLATL